MLHKIIQFSIQNKLLIFLFTASLIGVGLYSAFNLPVGAVPDVTNNQVQVLTTSRNLSTLDVEQFITYPVELEMANLQGVKEIRSISKFGLSVVTIVFEEGMGTYLPRQLISEKLGSAAEQIPAGYGTPEMGPISTGLGEIYQYLLDVKPGYEDHYSPMDLRTIQDWIVRRQLSGIPGVVEVNTWGGYLKQYEVAIDTEKLKAMNVSIQELFTALEKNNSVSGGGYIEKTNQSYFIRGEGLIESKADIENIFVKKNGNTSVFVHDVATVAFGFAPRFGAITANGEGEKVLGQVMMLKGANSNDVIERVKERVTEINKTLPEGVYINDFLERSALIKRTTHTVEENLIFGFLIVVFVVVLLLGNLRSGLVVASVIPLSLLFALTMMYIFGVDANLMSLGAIDFGIIIDGAVIIVEYVAFQLTKQRADFVHLDKREKRTAINKIAEQSASKMMSSAIFGQFIILIVFIPILSLTGVEGKMFKPMALAFSFALIGAMILCLTYVPAVSSLFLRPRKKEGKNISERFIDLLNSFYQPILKFALRAKALVIAFALALLVATVWLFSTMGAEFVPTLDEGDMVIQPVLKTGTSLEQTIEITTKIEEILLNEFPEVLQVASRIGAAEVPTDPMSMEESDVIIRLKPKSEWTSASSNEELANRFKEELAVIPGMEVEFTQPIEMRFNELITGVRADIAVKIQGENLDMLYQKAVEIQSKIQDIEGAADITVEKTVGLPQMTVDFNREKIARYGLHIEDVNDIISMAFGGRSAGLVFEGEKRFDLVVRLDKSLRQDITHLSDLLIDTPTGDKIPLNEIATVTYSKGPAMISRDDTRRRIVVGINVRNRDLQSVVDDVKAVINNQVDLPSGYAISYGGQFENLQSARKRLMIAVPIALVLILIMLHFAFGSLKEALLIYTAIPLAAVGGVFFLWLRDLPFSISAGVGFIALFGIAVLNGIVLIEHLNELKKNNMSLYDRIIIGTSDRLRPVLLTAAAAALGFLPMAVSTNAGAEVQRPLATVVIGGLVTSTILTLFVLPVLYSVVESFSGQNTKANSTATLFLFLLFPFSISAQQAEPMTVETMLPIALNNNMTIAQAKLEADQWNIRAESPLLMDKTELFFGFDQNNLTLDNQVLNVFGVQQSFPLPGLSKSYQKYYEESAKLSKTAIAMEGYRIEARLRKAYHDFQITNAKSALYQKMDSLYTNYEKNAGRGYELGGTNYLELVNARAKQRAIRMKLKQLAKEKQFQQLAIQQILVVEEEINIAIEQPNMLTFEEVEYPQIAYYDQLKVVNRAAVDTKKKELLPNLNLQYMIGVANSTESPLHGAQLGVGVSIFNQGKKAEIRALQKNESLFDQQQERLKKSLAIHTLKQQAKIEQSKLAIDYYLSEGRQLADELVRTANIGYKNGDLDFFDYVKSLELAQEIELNYLNELAIYNDELLSKIFYTEN